MIGLTRVWKLRVVCLLGCWRQRIGVWLGGDVCSSHRLKRPNFAVEWVEFASFTVGGPGFQSLSGDWYYEVASPKCLDRLWSALCLLFFGYMAVFPERQSRQELEPHFSLPPSTLSPIPSWRAGSQFTCKFSQLKLGQDLFLHSSLQIMTQ